MLTAAGKRSAGKVRTRTSAANIAIGTSKLPVRSRNQPTAIGKHLAEQISGVDSEELRILQSVPKAALLPPDPILRFVTERRIRRLEASEAAER